MDKDVRQKSVVREQQATPELQTPRLVLRAVRESDVDDVFAIYSDLRALEYFARDPLKSREEAEAMVADKLAFGEDSAARFWAICLQDSDRMIGTFTLFHISEQNRRAEVGYIINSQFWGQGYGSEVLRRMIDYCFEDLDMVRLEADVDPQNTASLRMLERHGFEREGYFRKRWFMRDQWFDSVMFGLLRRDGG